MKKIIFSMICILMSTFLITAADIASLEEEKTKGEETITTLTGEISQLETEITTLDSETQDCQQKVETINEKIKEVHSAQIRLYSYIGGENEIVDKPSREVVIEQYEVIVNQRTMIEKAKQDYLFIIIKNNHSVEEKQRQIISKKYKINNLERRNEAIVKAIEAIKKSKEEADAIIEEMNNVIKSLDGLYSKDTSTTSTTTTTGEGE